MWADAANAALAAQGVNINAYNSKVYLLPPGVCPWVGLAYVGCDGTFACRAWIGGDFWSTPQAMAHEIGAPAAAGRRGALLQTLGRSRASAAAAPRLLHWAPCRSQPLFDSLAPCPPPRTPLPQATTCTCSTPTACLAGAEASWTPRRTSTATTPT